MANPVGESSWLAYLEESARTAADLDQRVNVVELFKRAVGAEPGSLRIWLAYCNYFWDLWSSCRQPAAPGWSEDDQAIGRDLFSFDAALDLWLQGYDAIKYRLDDSHLLWERWISLEMEQLAKMRTSEGVRRITHLYRDRLATPHLTWDDTSQAFSSFLSEYNSSAYEDTMAEITKAAQDTKRLIAARDPFELRLKKASRNGDLDTQQSVMRDYLEWEMLQSKRNNDIPEIARDLCCGLYSRALTGVFATDADIWLQYVAFLSSSEPELQAPEKLLDVLRRAVHHCPASGRLWNRYILCAEEAKLPFSDIESIKHAATSENQLYKNGMESMIEMYMAWCGFLKRNALGATATDEAVDLADVGLRAALEDVEVVGKRLYGKEFQDDPKFRLERVYIQYLTEKKGAIDEARAQWNKLAGMQIHADSHDFWLQYYMWEMLIFYSTLQPNRSPTPASSVGLGPRIPTVATAVLQAAATRRTMDWPEKVLEVYLQHCNDYELPAAVRRANDLVHKAEKAVRKRRQREEEEKAAAYAAYYAAGAADPAHTEDESLASSKRKRDAPSVEGGDDAAGANKRIRSDQEASQNANQAQAADLLQADLKRDRENSTILVTNLPADVTQTKIRQYFKEFGHINNITAVVQDTDGRSSTALVEFSSADQAQSALLRDGKYFGQSQISVQPGHDLTVYVTNYPPVADEEYIRRLFRDCGEILSVRWPSLSVNTHRRFCYVSFRDRAASAKAVAKEGTLLEGRYSLLAKYSDPAHRKNRAGALAEGRELHVANLDNSANEALLYNIFGRFGTVTRVNIPRTMGGKPRGFAYIDFKTKEEAEQAAEEMNNVKIRRQIIQVAISKESRVKRLAKSVMKGGGSEGAEPAHDDKAAGESEGVDGNGSGNGNGGGDGDREQAKPSTAEIASRSLALMGLPETVNDARVRALVDPHGTVLQLVLQPSRGSAKIEFSDTATAGKAALALDGIEFEGQRLRTGPVEELRRVHPASKETPARSGPRAGIFAPPSSLLRRPAVARAGASRGPAKAFRGAAPRPSENGDGAAPAVASKSNADFKAIFLAGKKDDRPEEKPEE